MRTPYGLRRARARLPKKRYVFFIAGSCKATEMVPAAVVNYGYGAQRLYKHTCTLDGQCNTQKDAAAEHNKIVAARGAARVLNPIINRMPRAPPRGAFNFADPHRQTIHQNTTDSVRQMTRSAWALRATF